MNYTSFKFPENDVVNFDSSLSRTINGTTCYGYRVVNTGSLRFGGYSFGTNANACSRAVPCVANNITDSPTFGTIYLQYTSTTSGA